jgi:hypothetical protein
VRSYDTGVTLCRLFSRLVAQNFHLRRDGLPGERFGSVIVTPEPRIAGSDQDAGEAVHTGSLLSG